MSDVTIVDLLGHSPLLLADGYATHVMSQATRFPGHDGFTGGRRLTDAGATVANAQVASRARLVRSIGAGHAGL